MELEQIHKDLLVIIDTLKWIAGTVMVLPAMLGIIIGRTLR